MHVNYELFEDVTSITWIFIIFALSRHFSEVRAIWLAFDSLNYFTTLIEKKNYLKVGSGGWLYLGKVLAP